MFFVLHKQSEERPDPVLVMGPPSLLHWLRSYGTFYDTINLRYKLIPYNAVLFNVIPAILFSNVGKGKSHAVRIRPNWEEKHEKPLILFRLKLGN